MSENLTDWACVYCGWNILGETCALHGPPDDEQRIERLVLCKSCWKRLRSQVVETEPA